MVLKQFAAHELPPMAQGIIHPLIDADLRAVNDAKGPKPTAAGTRFRASQAMECARKIGFEVAGFPEQIEIPPEVLLTFDVGNRFHERIQGIMQRQMGAQVEVVATYAPEFDLSLHADAVYGMDRDGALNVYQVAVEIKTVSGFGWLLATGGRKSDDGAGPKVEHVCQGALAANAPNIQAQYVHIIYIDKDKQGIAEWLLDMDEPLARYEDLTPRELAEAELARITGIGERLDSGKLPTRYIPGHGRVEVPPEPGSRNNPWQCRYCRFQPICRELVSMPVDLDDVWLMVREKGMDVTQSEA